MRDISQTYIFLFFNCTNHIGLSQFPGFQIYEFPLVTCKEQPTLCCGQFCKRNNHRRLLSHLSVPLRTHTRYSDIIKSFILFLWLLSVSVNKKRIVFMIPVTFVAFILRHFLEKKWSDLHTFLGLVSHNIVRHCVVLSLQNELQF